jgi:hypothetical protein
MRAFPVANSGPRQHRRAIVYDIHHLQDGSPNTDLVELGAPVADGARDDDGFCLDHWPQREVI